MPYRNIEQRNYFHPANGFSEVIIGIYRIYNKKSGKSYVGQAAGKTGVYGRWYDHWKCLMRGAYRNKHQKLQAAWDKYTPQDWVFGILEICEKTPSTLNAREKYWMGVYDVIHNGYNVSPTPSTTLGMKMTLEQRQRQSERMKKMHEDDPTIRQRMLKTREGYFPSVETRKKIGLSNLGKNIGRMGWNKGGHLSLEQRQHLSELHEGTHSSEETKAKLHALPKGKWMNNNHESKRVQEIDVPRFLAEGWVFGYKKRGYPIEP